MAKILVYDADPRFGEALKAFLISLGHDAVLAGDGYSVLPLAERHKPSLFILDYKLPEADGFEILKRLRSTPAFVATPVIFASATPKFEIEMTVMDAIAVGYVDKPLDGAQLKEAIAALLGPERSAAPAPAPAAPAARIPPPGAPLDPPGAPPQRPGFTGEPDLDGSRDGVIDLD